MNHHHRGDHTRRIAPPADRAYEVTDCVEELRNRSVAGHIAIDEHSSKASKPHQTTTDRLILRHAATRSVLCTVASASRRNLADHGPAGLTKHAVPRPQPRQCRPQAGTNGPPSDPPAMTVGGNRMRHLGVSAKRHPAKPTLGREAHLELSIRPKQTSSKPARARRAPATSLPWFDSSASQAWP